jgi:nucleoside-diphosphate-sugar epimerase
VKVAITGATGFVGGALARALAAQGHEVTALARVTSQRVSLADVDIRWVTGDVTDRDSLRGQFDGVDWLIHAAGMLGQAGVPESAYFQLHEQGTNHVLAEAETAVIPRILIVSSPGVLGPIRGLPADETAPLAPSNSYERSKAAAEQVAQVYARAGQPLIIVRPEFIYGPGDWHVLGLFRAVRDGKFFYVNGGKHVCHPTFIDDAVTGMLLALQKGAAGEIYHITGPEPVTFRELGETIAAELGVSPPSLNVPKAAAMLGALGLEVLGKVTGKRPPLSRTGVAFFSEDRCFSWRKAQAELGYAPHYDLQSGVAKTVAWYREKALI